MLFKRLAFGVATVALGVASAASTYKVQLDAPLSIGTTELKAGEYKVEMQGDKAVFKNGKTTIEVPATVGKSEKKYYRTSVVTEGTKLQEIDFGGTTESILFNTKGISATGTK
jgi:hypothetical protein